MKTLTVRWQRLVDEQGQTCSRCGSTEQELQKAFEKLRQSLAPLAIKVALEKTPLDAATCKKDITESNRIWIAGRPLEEWLDAKIGESPCGSCCSTLGQTVECRTVTVGGRTYEAIPAELIVKAGLLAASELVTAPSTESCCPRPEPAKKTGSSCCTSPAK